VQELLRLIGDRLDDVRMGVAGRGHRDAGGAVEEGVAVDVLDRGARSARDDQRIVTRVGRGDSPGVALDDGARLRTG
jgi:hypothetical protein